MAGSIGLDVSQNRGLPSLDFVELRDAEARVILNMYSFAEGTFEYNFEV
jgi:hypothetical protein